MRTAVRDSYRADPQLTADARADAHLKPGDGWVSALCAEPVVVQQVLAAMLEPYERDGTLRRLPYYEPIGAEVTRDHVDTVTFASTVEAMPVTCGPRTSSTPRRRVTCSPSPPVSTPSAPRAIT